MYACRRALTLGFVCASAVLSVPVLGASAPGLAQRPAHHRVVDFDKARALATPVTLSPRPPETDGLSREAEDCNYGCIDNGR